MSVPFFTADGLILRETRYKEADRILTILTSDRGRITAKARGALRKGSKLSAATQQLTFSELTFFENQGKLTVNEAVVKEGFDGLRKDFSAYALACYFAEAAETLTGEELPEPAVLQLILNCLYALSRNLQSPGRIKAVFELRLASILGYTPDLSACCICGERNPAHPVFGITSGHLCCRECREPSVGMTDPLTPEALSAMRHVIAAPPKQILSRAPDDASFPFFAKACEDFLLEQCGRGFQTLEYYRSYS